MVLKIKYVIRRIKVGWEKKRRKGLKTFSWNGSKSLFNYEEFEYSLLAFFWGLSSRPADSINLFQAYKNVVGDQGTVCVMNFIAKKNENNFRMKRFGVRSSVKNCSILIRTDFQVKEWFYGKKEKLASDAGLQQTSLINPFLWRGIHRLHGECLSCFYNCFLRQIAIAPSRKSRIIFTWIRNGFSFAMNYWMKIS